MNAVWSRTLVVAVLAASACVEAENPVEPATVLDSPALSVAADETGTAGNYLVRFRGNKVPDDFAERVAALGGEVIFAHARAGVAAVSGFSPEAASQLAGVSGIAGVDADAYTTIDANVDGVEAAEASPEGPTTPTAAGFYGRQWNMKAIGMPELWASSNPNRFGSSSVRVGILDTGLDYLHPDLIFRVNLALSRSFLNETENARVQAEFPGAHPVADLNFHGTHVGATVVSNGLAAAGVTSQTELVGIKVCSPGTAPNYQGSCPTSAVLAGILYAVDNDVNIINMSLGGHFNRRQVSAAGGDGPSFIATINQVMTYANRNGTLVVVSAGNDTIDMDHDGNGYKSYCSAPTVVCVSATGPTRGELYATPSFPRLGEYLELENVDALSGYSNFGRSAVTVAAPGGNRGTSSFNGLPRSFPVWAACSGFTVIPGLAGCRGRFYNTTTGGWSASVAGASGTSMAAPHVTGVAALIAARGVTDPAAIRDILMESADDVGQSGTDAAYGKGRVNAASAAQ